MSFKTNILADLSDRHKVISDKLGNYEKIGKNPLDVTYDIIKMEKSLECIDFFKDTISKLKDDDATCSIELPKIIIAKIKEKLAQRKELREHPDEDGHTEKAAEIDGWMVVCGSMATTVSSMSSSSAGLLDAKRQATK